MKSQKNKKSKLKENNNLLTFLNERIKRINKNLEKRKNKFRESKNDLFSDKNFSKNITSHSNISLLIKK